MSTRRHDYVPAEQPRVSRQHTDIHEAIQRARALRALWLATQLRRLVRWMRERLQATAGRPVPHAG